MKRYRTLVRAALLSVMTYAPVADGQTARDAEALFREGSSAFERGDYRAAALAFEEADRTAPRGVSLYNAAVSWQRAGEALRSADDLVAALGRGDLDAAQTEAVKKSLDATARSLGRLRVEVAPKASVRIDGADRLVGAGSIYVRPGTHHIEVTLATGERTAQDASVRAGAETVVRLQAPLATVSRPTPPLDRTIPEPRGVPTLRTFGFVGLGLSASSVAVATLTGLLGLHARDEFARSDYSDADAHDRAATFRLSANVAWTTAVVTGIAGLVLLWHPWLRSRAPAARTAAEKRLEWRKLER